MTKTELVVPSVSNTSQWDMSHLINMSWMLQINVDPSYETMIGLVSHEIEGQVWGGLGGMGAIGMYVAGSENVILMDFEFHCRQDDKEGACMSCGTSDAANCHSIG
jgi:hypothetical protein